MLGLLRLDAVLEDISRLHEELERKNASDEILLAYDRTNRKLDLTNIFFQGTPSILNFPYISYLQALQKLVNNYGDQCPVNHSGGVDFQHTFRHGSDPLPLPTFFEDDTYVPI